MTQQASQDRTLKGDVTRLSWPLRLFVKAMSGLDQIAPRFSTRLMLSRFFQPRRKKASSYESRLPAGARRLGIQHGPHTLTGWVWGQSGPSILVLHGWESHTGRMLPLIKPLLAQGYRVFALDAPGHGLSPRANTHLLDVGEAIQAMMAQHGPFDGVIAHSFGAAAVSLLLARRPHLMPRSLVLLSPMRDLAQHLDIFAGIAQLSPVRKSRLAQAVSRRLGISLAECSPVEAARRLNIPGLVIHDQSDRLIPHEVGEAYAQNWRGAQFVSTNGLGHRRGLGNEQVTGRIVDFFAAQGLANGRPRTANQFHTPLPTTRTPRLARTGRWRWLPNFACYLSKISETHL